MREALALWLGLLLATPALAAAPDDPPSATVRSLLSTLQTFEAGDAEAARRAHAALDFVGLARGSLGATWAKLSADERSRFLDLLRRIFAEVAYPRSAEFFEDIDIELAGGGRRRGLRVVEAAVSHPEEGPIDLGFFLAEVDGRWKIRDLTLDGVSLGRDLRSRMQRIIREDGYPELIARMEKKLEPGASLRDD
jgi:phospholipid transport system substrate-binding protein